MKLEKNKVVWTVFALSVVIVVAAVGFLAVDAWRHRGEDQPELRVDVSPPERNRVRIVVRNEGDSTADQVRIELRVMRGATEMQRATITLPFVPRLSRREAEVVFTRPIDERDVVEVASIAYERP